VKILALCAAVTVLAPTLAVSEEDNARSILGVWKTAEDGAVEIYACGAAVCGRLAPSPALPAGSGQTDSLNKDPALRERKLLGLTIITGMSGGPPRWVGGAIYNPRDGHTYKGELAPVGPDRLKVTGCLVPPLCRSQIWTR